MSEDIKTLFFRLIDENKFKYVMYITRIPPDKEWYLESLFYNNDVRTINTNLYVQFRHNIIDTYKLSKTLTDILEEKIDHIQINALELPSNLLHSNLQAILICVSLNKIDNIDNITSVVPYICISILQKHINHINDSTNDNIMRIMTKLKNPINEIISSSTRPDVVKRSSLSIAIIINDMIDLYKLKKNRLRLQRKEFDFRKFINEIIDLVEFKVLIDDDVPDTIYIDQRRLKQVIMNLIKPDTSMYISASLCFDVTETEEVCQSKLEFNLDNIETLSEERTFITKKIISLMNGSLTIIGNEARFTIRVFKDSNGFSTTTLKKIKGTKICVMANSPLENELIDKLTKYGAVIEYSPNKANILIVAISLLEKIINSIQIPYLILSDCAESSDSRDVSPVNSPRINMKQKHLSISKNNILHYPIDDLELLSMILDRIK